MLFSYHFQYYNSNLPKTSILHFPHLLTYQLKVSNCHGINLVDDVLLLCQLAIPELRRELGRVSNFNQLINWHHHMKGHVQSCHLTKFNAFGVNGEEVIGHWNMVNIHTNVCNLETAFQQPYKFLKCLISFVITVKCYHSVTIWKKLRRKARMLARF